MKKLLAILLVMSLLTVYAVPVNAADTSGQCGDNLTWTISDNILTISGTGPMYDYSQENPAPWMPITTGIKRIIIEEGVTSIGNRAFYFSKTATTVDVIIASSVNYIGDRAFWINKSGCEFDIYLLGDVPEIGVRPFGCFSCLYVVNWDDAAKKSLHLADSFVKDATIYLDVLSSRQLIGLNEELKPEDLTFRMYQQRYVPEYIPRELSFSAYDNSTYGMKTVTVTADGFSFAFTYCVTDGTNHQDLINVAFPELPEYNNGRGVSTLPTITMGSMELVRGDHYDLEFATAAIGNDSRVTVKGKGIAQGFEKTFYYPVLKKDITDASVYTHNQAYKGEPLDTSFSVSSAAGNGKQYCQALYENNINVGQAGIRVVGKENYYGETKGSFWISLQGESVNLPGECIGTFGDELNNNNIPYYEQIIMPSKACFRVDCPTSVYHVAAYALYRVNEEGTTLIQEYVSDVSNSNQSSEFKYDFTYVYEDAADTGGEVYLLSYSWVTEYEEVYAGAMVLIIPSKIPDATSMTMEHVENDGDFRKEYFNLIGDDGVLGPITWSVSDPSVATVENGTVTLKKPGTVTVSGQCGDMVESCVLTAPQLDLTEGIIFDYSEENGARVIYDSRLLTEGMDYVLTVAEEGNGIRVTATGCGLFAGELEKTFNGLDSFADPHTHSFDNGCDGTCNSCDFIRSNDHKFAESWTKNQTHHYYVCTACGEQTDYAEHSLSAEDDTVCTVCGPLHTPGDLNTDYSVNEDDAIYLLQHVLLPEFFPVAQAVDYTGDNKVDEDDAIYLLQHVLLPEFFPL